jgi:hypothetical protein
MSDESEVQEILKLQTEIAQRLDQLGFLGSPGARGNIIHHLAEAAVIGKKLEQEFLRAFLGSPMGQQERLEELVVDMHCELMELRDGLSEMEPAFVELMNFVTRYPK